MPSVSARWAVEWGQGVGSVAAGFFSLANCVVVVYVV